jgi:hypothetical protein
MVPVVLLHPQLGLHVLFPHDSLPTLLHSCPFHCVDVDKAVHVVWGA